MEATLSNLQPLVLKAEELPSYLHVTFRCPVTATEVRAEGHYPDDSVVGRQAKQAKRTLFSSIRNKVAAEIRQQAGPSMVGSIAGNAVANVAGGGHDVRPNNAPQSQANKDAALLAAFASVSSSFAWDDKKHQWVSSGAAVVEKSAFTEHTNAHPVPQDDTALLHRLLAALIASDGSIGEDEKESFAAMAPGVDLDKLARKRAPKAVDFEEAANGPSRETFLLLGWAVALSDEELAPEEEALMGVAAKGLQVSDSRAAELKDIAQRYILDEAITALAAAGTDVDDIRDQVEDLGEKIGLGADEAARVVIRWSKRN